MTYVNRTLCDVLEEMRKCNETHNFSYLLGLIEEAQSMGNKMDAALQDRNDLITLSERKAELEQQVKDLRKNIKDAGEKPVTDW